MTELRHPRLAMQIAWSTRRARVQSYRRASIAEFAVVDHGNDPKLALHTRL